jgi:hypothetical protein
MAVSFPGRFCSWALMFLSAYVDVVSTALACSCIAISVSMTSTRVVLPAVPRSEAKTTQTMSDCWGGQDGDCSAVLMRSEMQCSTQRESIARPTS